VDSGQFVLFDVILEGLSLVSGRWCRLRSTGEWLDDRSDNGLALIRLRGMFFVTAKSIKYGRFLESVGQYVCEAGETSHRIANLNNGVVQFPSFWNRKARSLARVLGVIVSCSYEVFA